MGQSEGRKTSRIEPGTSHPTNWWLITPAIRAILAAVGFPLLSPGSFRPCSCTSAAALAAARSGRESTGLTRIPGQRWRSLLRPRSALAAVSPRRRPSRPACRRITDTSPPPSDPVSSCLVVVRKSVCPSVRMSMIHLYVNLYRSVCPLAQLLVYPSFY